MTDFALYDCENGRYLLLTRKNPKLPWELSFYLGKKNEINLLRIIKQFDFEPVDEPVSLLEMHEKNPFLVLYKRLKREDDTNKLLTAINELKIEQGNKYGQRNSVNGQEA